MGSTNTDFCNFKLNQKVAYIFGLWCADGYQWSSSIGLSNTDPDLIKQFSKFFLELFPPERLKWQIYYPNNKGRVLRAYHLYVNSRPLLRRFRKIRQNLKKYIKERELILPYMAGRFDGDGSVAKDFRRDCRIVYSNYQEAKVDSDLLHKLNFKKVKIYHYRSARTFCLYISRLEASNFLSQIYFYSVKLQKSVFVPRRDSLEK